MSITAQMSRTHHYAVPRNRSALVMTEAELGLSASAAIIGDSSRGFKGKEVRSWPDSGRLAVLSVLGCCLLSNYRVLLGALTGCGQNQP